MASRPSCSRPRPGEEAGLKSATFTVTGENAYGILKAERGVHRLVRLSPFDQAHRRHTSFAQVIVSPLVADDVDVEIDETDLRIDTYRASGAGGQHVNKTDSAVRITHLPTGIVVQCQNERSQLSNKQTAMRILKSRLVELEQEKREAELAAERGAAQDIGFGSQIRSYVLHPYQLVKDHRTGYEEGNTQAVLDGRLDEFIHAYLLQQAGAGLPASASGDLAEPQPRHTRRSMRLDCRPSMRRTSRTRRAQRLRRPHRLSPRCRRPNLAAEKHPQAAPAPSVITASAAEPRPARAPMIVFEARHEGLRAERRGAQRGRRSRSTRASSSSSSGRPARGSRRSMRLLLKELEPTERPHHRRRPRARPA